MSVVLMVTFLAAYAIRESNLTIIHESSVAILLGVFVGVAVESLGAVNELNRLVLFNQETFFIFILPPIIFASGYNMKRTIFFKNIVAILSFAFIGSLSWTSRSPLSFLSLQEQFSMPLSLRVCCIF